MLAYLLKQPLLHFLLTGAAIFLVFELRSPATESEATLAPNQILVDRTALLNFMQYRARAFEPTHFEAQLQALSDAERDALIQDYVREEALYREALNLGMDEGDYIIRLRLVQKVEFLLENLVLDVEESNEDALRAFYDERLDDYHVDAVYTFTHIFFDAQQGGMEAARQRAQALVEENPGIAFEAAGQYGDRYPFLQNYVERNRDYIVNNFNTDFVEALDLIEPDNQLWVGPLASRYGQHLVILRERREPFIPALQDIRERVLDDYRYEMLATRRREAEDTVVAEYEVIQAL